MRRSVMLKITAQCGHGTGGRPDGGRDLQKSMEIIHPAGGDEEGCTGPGGGGCLGGEG